MYSLNSLRMPSMSSAVLSSANVHDLQALAGGSPWWANTVHHVITSPSHRTSVLVWMLIEWQMPTLLLYTASCTRRMRVTAFFTSRVIALDFLRWAGAGLAHLVKLILTCSRLSWCCACGSSSRAAARAGHHRWLHACLP